MRKLTESTILSAEERELLTRCRVALQALDPTADVILYGSRARGDAQTESDYDLLIVVEGNATLEKENLLCRQLFPIQIETGKVITAFVFDRKSWNTPLYRAMPFHKNVEKDGIVI